MSAAGARWNERRRRWREKAAHLTPKVLTHYPFEVLAAVISLLLGGPLLTGLATSQVLLALVGPVPFYAWASGLVLGAVTAGVGLKIHNALVVASGLQLVGLGFLIFSIAIFAVVGGAGWANIIVFVCLGLLSLIRATHFRRVIDIQIGASRRRLE